MTLTWMPDSFSIDLHRNAVYKVSCTLLARDYGGYHPLPTMRHHLSPGLAWDSQHFGTWKLKG